MQIFFISSPALSYPVGMGLKSAYTVSLTDIKYKLSVYYNDFLFFCIGIMKILEYCKEQGECSEKECKDLMKKYEIC